MISQVAYEEQLKQLGPLYEAEADEFNMRRQAEYNCLQANESIIRKALNLAERATVADIKDLNGDITMRISMVQGWPEDVNLPSSLEDQLRADRQFFEAEWSINGQQHESFMERFREFVGITIVGFFDNDIIISMEKTDCRTYRKAKRARISERHKAIIDYFGGQSNVPTELSQAMDNEFLQLTEQWGEEGIFFNSILKRSEERLKYRKDSWDQALTTGTSLINDTIRIMGNLKL